MPSATTVEAYRTSWLTTLRTNPGASVTQLRSKAPGIYTWLYRHDKVWLKEQMPVCTKKNKTSYQRVDWAERDTRLAEEVISAVTRLKNLPGRPVHITLSAIGRELGQVALLQQHLDKLPKTAEALKEHIDSREGYAVRRIRWAALDCIQSNVYLVRWLLIRKAGVARIAESPVVKEAIENILQELKLTHESA